MKDVNTPVPIQISGMRGGAGAAWIVRTDRKLAVGLFFLALALGIPGAFYDLPAGKAIAGASRILDGEAPYRDFWSMYAPGQFYAVAAVLAIAGREVVAQALATVVVRAFSALTFFVLLRRVGAARKLSIVLSVVFIGMLWSTAPELTSYHLALPLLLLALDRVVSFCRGAGGSALTWAGLWLGFATFFKHDVAAYIAAGAIGSFFLTDALCGKANEADRLSPLKATSRLIAATLPVVGLLVLWLAWMSGPDAWNDLIVFPATAFRHVRAEGYLPLLAPFAPLQAWVLEPTDLVRGHLAFDVLSQWILVRVPECVFLVAVGVATVRRRQWDVATAGIVAVCLTSMPLFWIAANVQRNTHLHSMAIFSMLLGVVASRHDGIRTPRSIAVRRVLVATLCVYAAGLWTAPAMDLFFAARNLRGSRTLPMNGIRGILVTPRDADVFETIGGLVREKTPGDERVFHAVSRNESIVINRPILYAVMGRRACCRYSELHPGVTDREPVQREIIEDLERQQVRAVVVWNFGWGGEVLDDVRDRHRAALADGGSTVLNEYIAAHFEPIVELGEYVLLWRSNDFSRSAR